MDNGGANKVSTRVKFRGRDISAFKDNVSAILFSRCNKFSHPLLRSRRYERSSWGKKLENTIFRRCYRAHRSVPFSKPPFTLSILAFSTRPGNQSDVSPTMMAA